MSHLVHLLPSTLLWKFNLQTARFRSFMQENQLCDRGFQSLHLPLYHRRCLQVTQGRVISFFGWGARQRAREVRKGANNLLWLSHTALHVNSTFAEDVHYRYFDLLTSWGCQASYNWILFLRVLNGAWPRRGSFQTRAARIVRPSTIFFLMPPIWSERRW